MSGARLSPSLSTALVLAFAAGALIRIYNAAVFPLMNGYDAYAHFGYVWFLAEEGRLPAPTAGWEFFQPPAWYVYALAFWKGLPSIDPLARLRLANATVAALAVVPAWVAMRAAGRTLGGSPVARFCAAAFVLFLPVHLYSAGFFGNETLCAVLSSVALAMTFAVLERPTVARCLGLGLAVGVAMLSKFTALVVAVAAVGAVALDALRRREVASGAARVAIVAGTALAVCGWFYGRNFLEYGNPFQMSREKLFLSQIEESQPQGRRSFAEYVLFDPVILYRPQWPRGLSLDSQRPEDNEPSALRESVPTGFYANTWFDGFGGFVAPRILGNDLSRRAGQILLVFGLVPTFLVFAGIFVGVRRLARDGWDHGVVVMLLATAAMLAVVVQGTRTVPTHAAVKATYLMPISAAFAFWFALGFDWLARRRPALSRIAGAACTFVAVVSACVFTHGLVFREWAAAIRAGNPASNNLYGVVYAAAGERETARQWFESARGESPLANENLADYAIAEGRLDEALVLMKTATRQQNAKITGATPPQRAYIRATLADYANTRAVIAHGLGRSFDAMREARAARTLDRTIPEVHYNIGVLMLENASNQREGRSRTARLRRAQKSLRKAYAFDPAFREAQAMLGVAAATAGDCATGSTAIREALAPHPGEHRLYPTKTGPGDQNSAALHRRRRIESTNPALDPAARLAACDAANSSGVPRSRSDG